VHLKHCNCFFYNKFNFFLFLQSLFNVKLVKTRSYYQISNPCKKNYNYCISFSFELNKIFFAFPFCVPDYFALLTRAMIVLEGIAVSGNPEFDLFTSAYPYAFRRAVNLFGFSDLSQIAAVAVKNKFARM